MLNTHYLNTTDLHCREIIHLCSKYVPTMIPECQQKQGIKCCSSFSYTYATRIVILHVPIKYR